MVVNLPENEPPTKKRKGEGISDPCFFQCVLGTFGGEGYEKHKHISPKNFIAFYFPFIFLPLFS